MSPSILVINAGSSSIKYQLIDTYSDEVLASGVVQRIGMDGATQLHQGSSGPTERDVEVPSHDAAMRLVLAAFEEFGPPLAEAGIVGVGHRVVMGGAEFYRPALVTDRIISAIEALSPLAPLHNPANVAALKIARGLLPDVAHVAVFDTAFFHDLPAAASTYAIDLRVAEAQGIRRYGFHGISHEYVSGRVESIIDPPRPDRLRQVVLHLGNGASASAVVGGRAVDTSMGFTPLEGLVMGTRSGDIDPAVAFHLHRNAGLSIDDIDGLLNHRSGMLGLTGHSDMRDVHSAVADRDERSRLALSIYVRRIQKYIGAYAAVMGGLDAVTFTAGVGENDPIVRTSVAVGLGFLGIHVDEARNSRADDDERFISPDGSPVALLVVPTREELSIARQVAALV